MRIHLDSITAFLADTYENPLQFFDMKKVVPYATLSKDNLVNQDHFHLYRRSARELYKQYLEWIEQYPLNTPLTQYQFTAGVNRLRMQKDGWQFIKARWGRLQIVSFTPLVLKRK